MEPTRITGLAPLSRPAAAESAANAYLLKPEGEDEEDASEGRKGAGTGGEEEEGGEGRKRRGGEGDFLSGTM